MILGDVDPRQFPRSDEVFAALAKYVKDPANPPGKSLVLARADDVEILDYVSSTSRTITLTLSGTGTPPSSNWTADVDMDLKLAAGAAWP